MICNPQKLASTPPILASASTGGVRTSTPRSGFSRHRRHRADSFHLLGELYRFVVHEGTRVETLMGHHPPDLSTLHAHISGVVNREAQHVPQIFLQRMAAAVIA